MEEKRTRIIQTVLVILLMATIVSLLVACAVLSADILVGTHTDGISVLLSEAGLPDFNAGLVDLVESCFEDYYYQDIPERTVLAQKTVEAYNEFCRDGVNSEDIDEVTNAIIDCYIYAIGDKYGAYRTEDESDEFTTDMSGSFVGIGVAVLTSELEKTVEVTSVEEGSPAKNAGILPGDFIIAVDGSRIEEIGIDELLSRVRGTVGTSVTVTVLRGTEEIPFTMVREHITETTVALSYLEDGRVAYLKITGFKSNTDAQFIDAINKIEASGAEAVIFDLCNNPGGYLTAVVNMLSYLVPDGTPIVSFSSSKLPMCAESGKGSMYENTDHVFNLPSAVIVNGNSASASELFSHAMKDYNAMGILDSVVVGSLTYKKGVMQSTIPFSNGGTLTLTTALYNPPSGVNFNEVGVVPDVPVPDGEDPIEKALEILLTEE